MITSHSSCQMNHAPTFVVAENPPMIQRWIEPGAEEKMVGIQLTTAAPLGPTKTTMLPQVQWGARAATVYGHMRQLSMGHLLNLESGDVQCRHQGLETCGHVSL